MKVVLITNSSKSAKYLEHVIIQNGIDLVKVIRLTPKKQNSKNERLSKRLSALLRFNLRILKRRFLQITNKSLAFESKCKNHYNNKTSAYIDEKSKGSLNTSSETLEVDNVNSDIVVSELNKIAPDICVVWGTPIIKKNVLQTCQTFLNAHTSLLPYFKGTRSEFWQCLENSPETVGVTFHKIDEGVNTGPIIEQIPQKKLTPFEPYNLRYQNSISIFENYPRIILSVISGKHNYSIQEKNDSFRTYKSADITIPKRVEFYQNLLQTQPILN